MIHTSHYERSAPALRRAGLMRHAIMRAVEQARAWVQAARRICVLTGAGISAESGIPTWRSGPDALWRQFRPEELASPEGFARDPKTVWEWYSWRRSMVAQAQPNAGHLALALWDQTRAPLTVVTQNVDGLHQRAGSPDVICLHGDIWTVRCTCCGQETRDERVPLPELPPLCATCGGILRPAIVWFGEELPERAWDASQAAAWQCDVLLVVGTSAAVYPAALLAPLAQSNGAKVVEVNTEETPLSERVDRSLRGTAGTLLPDLLAGGMGKVA